MDLHQLVQNANASYDLKLDATAVEAVCQQLRRAGVTASVSGSATGQAIDMIVSFAKRRQRGGAHEIYASLKTEPASVTAESADDVCPRCSTAMKRVLLVGDRKADYCQPCNITLPVKIEA